MAAPLARASSRSEPQQLPHRVNSSVSYGKDAQLVQTQSDAISSTAPAASSGQNPQSPPSNATHQRFVLTDPVAFRYLEDDPSTTVLARNVQLEGYECYIVEQWACSRTHPTFVITTYTGDPEHTIIASVLSVPTDETAWSPQLRVYYKALSQYHARRRETPMGTLMITNLSGFPSSLTVIPVPNGDVKKHREHFYVNEDLKRLGCSGRAGLKLETPSSATQAKFHQLYRTSEKIPLNGAVLELVRLCQIALHLFGKLEAEYIDGLLCDVTEKAINDWWVEYGTDFYNVEPHDGILGPTTVAALLGMLMGARNRLNACGAPVPKDVFNVESMKRGIAHFQKSQRIQRTRRLDHKTLNHLRRSTAKAASGEGWTMPKAVKSTVAELSGKGGEMVMEMVGARDKAGIADIETVDIERFVDLVYGERPKWLWHGKPRKSISGDMFSRLPREQGLVFQQDDQGGYAWKSRKREQTEELMPSKSDHDGGDELRKSFEVHERDHSPKRTVLKKATGRINDARSGFEKIKDAVGRRNHQSKHSRDEYDPRLSSEITNDSQLRFTDLLSPQQGRGEAKEPVYVQSPEAVASQDSAFNKPLSETPAATLPTTPFSVPTPAPQHEAPSQPLLGIPGMSEMDISKAPTTASSLAGSMYRGVDLNDILPVGEDPDNEVGLLLRRTKSETSFAALTGQARNEYWWPRHLSFSLGEERVLTWKPINDVTTVKPDAAADPAKQLSLELLQAEDDRRTRAQLAALSRSVGEWVTKSIDLVRELDEQAYRDQAELEDTTYYPRLDEYHSLRQDLQDVISRERSQLSDALKDVEVLGAKLEYEINALRSRVEDVEDGVAEFERQVLAMEDRVKELEQEAREKEGWLHWMVRLATGLGKAPAKG